MQSCWDDAGKIHLGEGWGKDVLSKQNWLTAWLTRRRGTRRQGECWPLLGRAGLEQGPSDLI